MPAKNLGTRRHCQSCGESYYDFDASPIICPYPECGKEFDPEVMLKSRRSRPVAQPTAKPAEAAGDGAAESGGLADNDIDAVDGDVDDAEDDNNEVLQDDSDIIKVKKDDDDDDEEAVISTADSDSELDALDDDGDDGDDDADGDDADDAGDDDDDGDEEDK